MVKGILLAASISLWAVLAFLHLLINKYFILFPDAVSPPVPPLLYQFFLFGFLLSNTLYIRMVFFSIDRMDVLTLLWRLFIIGIIGVTLLLVLMLVSSQLNQMASSSLTAIVTPIFYSMSWYALLAFFLSAVFIYNRFILYQKSRRKIVMWTLFTIVITLSLSMTLRAFLFNDDTAAVEEGLDLAVKIIAGILMVLLSANVSWSAYLNFSQKFRAMGLFLLVIVVSVTYIVILRSLPEELGMTAGTKAFLSQNINTAFIELLVAFTLVYSSISILVLFFNLPTSSVFEQRSSEIASLSKINQAILSSFNTEEMFDTLIDACMLSANAQKGWVELIDESGSTRLHTIRGTDAEEIQTIERGYHLLQRVRDESRYLLIKNTRRHPSLRKVNTAVRSLLAMPIIVRGELYGVINLGSEFTNSFEDVALTTIKSFADQAGAAIENASLIRNAIDLERYQEQLKIAKEVQRQLLPQVLPDRGDIAFAVQNDTADEVGGDYYDILPYEGGYKIAIGDVSGKGATAAFYMAEVKGIFHALGAAGLPPEDFVRYANQAVAICFQRSFFLTLTYLQIDTTARRVSLIRAGHCPAMRFIADEQRVCVMREGSPGLGILRNAQLERFVPVVQSWQYQPGDVLVLYTDGVIEARDTGGTEYGYSRIESLILQHNKDSAKQISEAIIEDVKTFAGQEINDDYTVLVLKFNPLHNTPPSST